MIVDVSVVPNSRKFGITVSKDGKVKISLESEPENNRANIELVVELSKLLGREVRLVSGHKSKHKKLAIDLQPEDWNKFLLAFRTQA